MAMVVFVMVIEFVRCLEITGLEINKIINKAVLLSSKNKFTFFF